MWKHKDGRLRFPWLATLIDRVLASWANKRYISSGELDEIRRGN